MTLPKWVEEIVPSDETTDEESIEKLKQALAVAIEALEFVRDLEGKDQYHPGEYAVDALAEIERMGCK